MEIKTLQVDELRKEGAAKLRETEGELRKQLATLRLEEYTAGVSRVGQMKTLKRNLARVLTVKAEKK